jgi:hypothetical protein
MLKATATRTFRLHTAILALLFTGSMASGQTAGDFRNVTSGDWGSASTWETYDGSTWVAAAAAPTDVDGAITVRSPHAVTVVAGLTVDEVTVEAGATLAVSGGVTLTVNDGAGVDVTVNGTLAAAGTINGTGTIAINGGVFRIDEGGWGGNTNLYSYDAAGVLVFNNSTGPYAVNSDAAFWPNPVTNVTVQGIGGILMNAGRTVTGTFQTSASVNNAFNLTLAGTAQINAGGFFGDAPVYSGSSTLVYNSGGPYGVSGEWTGNGPAGSGVPQNVVIQNGTTVTLPNADRGIPGDFTIASGDVSLNGTSGDIFVGGNWTRSGSGTFTPNNRAVFLNGTGAQSITGATTFDYLLVNKSSGTLTLVDDITVNQGLTLTNGIVTTGTQRVFLGSGAFAARTNGYVNGIIVKNFAAGTQSFTYPIGTATAYAPVELGAFTVTTPGSVTASTADGDHPGIASSGLDPARSVNRSWTLAKDASLAFTSYDPAFTFVPTDIDGGADAAIFRIKRYDGVSWSGTTPGTRTATSTQATGVTSFSDFAVGEPVSHTIAATATSGGSITPSGSVLVTDGADTAFIITANVGSHIDSVVVDGVDQGVIGSYTFTNVTANHTISAYFSLNTYTVTATASAGGAIAPSGAVTVNEGADQTFTITANVGYHIDSVVVDGVNGGAIGTYTFTGVAANHSIAAFFSITTYTITAAVVGNATITPAGAVLVAYGSDTTFTVLPDANHHVDSLVVDGINLGPAASHSFTAVSANHTITAYVSVDMHVITTAVVGNGSISPSGSISVPHGADTTFAIDPATGWHLDSVVVDGVDQGPARLFTFTNVIAPHTITAYFSINIYTITATAFPNGAIVPPGAVTVPYGTDQTFTLTPDTGYHVDSLVVDGLDQGPLSSYTFTGVAANHTITAYFSVNMYTITATAGAHGSIAPSGPVSIPYGASQMFTAVPDSGYLSDSLIVDGVDQGPILSYTFTGVSANHTIRAVFQPTGFIITALAVGGGTITPSGSVVVPNGGSQTFAVLPDTGHHIDSVVVDGVNLGVLSSYLFSGVDTSHAITAYFSINTYTLVASAVGSGTITPTDTVSVTYGGTQMFTITPAVGHHIDSVVVDGVSQGAPSSYTFVGVDTNHTIVAHFSINAYTIVAAAVDSGSISPAGNVIVTYGGNQIFLIAPMTGYHTDSVVVDGANLGILASYTFTSVDTNHFITAYFSINTFPVFATAIGGGTISPSDTVQVPLGANQTFTVTPDTGYHVDSVLVDGANQGAITSYIFVAVDTSHTITAYFSINFYTITAAAVGNGFIAPSGSVILAHGTSQTFTVTPDTGYHVDSLVVDGVNRGPLATYTFTSVSAGHTITAYISVNVFTVTATAGPGGTISPSGVVNATFGATLTFTIAPNLGRHIDSVVVDGVNQGPLTSFTFLNIVVNHTIQAWFSIDLFTIMATADSDGVILPAGAVRVAYGSSRAFAITARRGHGVLDVLVDSVSVGPLTAYTFTNITANHTIHASFKQVNVFLTLSPDSILARDPLTSRYWKPAKRYRNRHPNWANLLSEVVYQGGFQPGATESDGAGGMRVGVSYMHHAAPYVWKPVKDSAATMAWIRLTKWDLKKNVGKNYTTLQRTLEDRTGEHFGAPRGFDYQGRPGATDRPLVKQLLLLPPKKQDNVLFAELVALKFNIAASQLDKTPIGFGELVYVNDGHPYDGKSIVEISAMTDTILTRWRGVEDSLYEQAFEAIYDINRAFLAPVDTLYFNDGGQLVLDGQVDLADIAFLRRDSTVAPRRLARTNDVTEGEEEFDDTEFEEGVPVAAKLYQNYPNPFNPSTTINFRLREPSLVTIVVYDLLGREVTALVRDEELEEGYQAVEFIPGGLASGVYFCRIDVQGLGNEGLRTVATNKMLLLK